MIYKEQNYEKTHDLVRGQGELFRIQDYKMNVPYTLREITAITDVEAEFIISNIKRKFLINHPNLINLVNHRFEIVGEHK